MHAWLRPSSYLPDRSPTWTEVLLGAVLLVAYAPTLASPADRSVPAVAVGFVAFALALGPGASSRAGEWIGRWFRAIGIAGRTIAIVLFALLALAVSQHGAAPTDLLADAALGGILAVLVYLAAFLLLARDVSGWTSHGQRLDSDR